jgi:phosphoglycerate kinase
MALKINFHLLLFLQTSELLGKEVKFAKDDEVVVLMLRLLCCNEDGDVVLLKIHVSARKKQRTLKISKDLASITDVFVMDAFGSAHRAHCSTAGITDYIKEQLLYLMQKEISILETLLKILFVRLLQFSRC